MIASTWIGAQQYTQLVDIAIARKADQGIAVARSRIRHDPLGRSGFAGGELKTPALDRIEASLWVGIVRPKGVSQTK